MSTIPHVKVAFGDLAEQMKGSQSEVAVPREILARLLDLYISCWDFNEGWYLTTYPDVQEAIDRHLFPSGWVHFRTVGYFEGRLGAQPSVDAEWYMSTYPDVAKAMLQGDVASVSEHFINFGYREGRLPSDPNVHPRWYAPRYLPSAGVAPTNESNCRDHFIRTGYRQLAIPTPPR